MTCGSTPDFIAPLVRHFADPAVFAATANVFDWDGVRRTTGQRRMALRRCWFYKWWDLTVTEPVYTSDAGGGCAAFRRDRFVALGGFDPLYRPAYYEDVDLSYRAWMRGWRTVFEPGSVIYHREAATMRDQRRESQFRALLARNHVLFTIKNVGGWAFLAGFLVMAPVRADRRRAPARSAHGARPGGGRAPARGGAVGRGGAKANTPCSVPARSRWPRQRGRRVYPHERGQPRRGPRQ